MRIFGENMKRAKIPKFQYSRQAWFRVNVVQIFILIYGEFPFQPYSPYMSSRFQIKSIFVKKTLLVKKNDPNLQLKQETG